MGEHDCIRCEDAAMDLLPPCDVGRLMRSFIVCPTCGNKRCPKATFHEFRCTGSNEPGQPGSDYIYGPVGVLTAMPSGSNAPGGET